MKEPLCASPSLDAAALQAVLIAIPPHRGRNHQNQTRLRHEEMILQNFLAAGGYPDTQILFANKQIPLLVFSVHISWLEGVDALLAAGADVHARQDEALRWAAMAGHVPIVERLLAAGARATAEQGQALSWAAGEGHLTVVDRLLANIHPQHMCCQIALERAARRGHLPVVERLLAVVGHNPVCYQQALENAANMGHLSIVERLLSAGADIKVNTALWQAADAGFLPIVECLLAAGADVHTHEEASLRLAVANEHLPVVECLLAAGANVLAAHDGTEHLEKQQLFAETLDAVAPAIPPAQRRAVVSRMGKNMPTLMALDHAERRRTARTNGKAVVGNAPKRTRGRAAR